MPWLNKDDLNNWAQGSFFDSYRKLGAHPNAQGTWFCVWAPSAEHLSVIGDFNNWDPNAHPLRRIDANLWQGYVRGAKPGHRYKFNVRRGAYQASKSDPFAFSMEPPVENGSPVAGLSSVITDLAYTWQDADWMANRKGPSGMQDAVSIYEVHLGSWRKKADGNSFSYREIAEPLADHVEALGFTHVELMPVMEHPYYGSWGYQVVGYYAPTYRYGSPSDLKYLIDSLHQRGIGVLLDWVPAHFATDPQGLVFWDGSTLFEYDDPVMRSHPDWGTYVFDYNKPGVRNFLISNALFWLDEYHIDGLRFDAVASMLYRDYSRDHWTPNMFGGRENLEAIDFLKKVNEETYTRFPEAMMVAEESTAWPGVSAPTFNQGLGFLYKWNMGWMHDTLTYFSKDPLYRKYHHNDLTFPLVYAFSEHYTLPLSHDEVVHGKGSLWGKMPGDPWQKAANLRLLYGFMFGHPGKKLLFMGCEFGQDTEWNHDGEIGWHLLRQPLHQGIMQWLTDLNTLYTSSPALATETPQSFAWIDHHDYEQSVVSFVRRTEDETLLFVLNATPRPRYDYQVGVPQEGLWREMLNSDATVYGGSGVGNNGFASSEPVAKHGHEDSLSLTLPPLGVIILKPEAKARPTASTAETTETEAKEEEA